jgi:hypothetical protein
MGAVMNSGPPPKDPSQRRRRNLTPDTLQLPMEGYDGPIPDWPLSEATAREMERWERLWKTPMAKAWVRMHIDVVVARYVRCAIMVEGGDTDDAAHRALTVAAAHLHSEVRQLEDRLGLNPLSLLRLRWEIAEVEVGDVAADPAPKRRLKAVDPSASEE